MYLKVRFSFLKKTMMGYRAARLWQRQLAAIEALETMIDVKPQSSSKAAQQRKTPKPKTEESKREKPKKECVKVDENFSIPLL